MYLSLIFQRQRYAANGFSDPQFSTFNHFSALNDGFWLFKTLNDQQNYGHNARSFSPNIVLQHDCHDSCGCLIKLINHT